MKQSDVKDNPWRTGLIVGFCIFISNRLSDWGWLQFPFGILLTFTVAALIEYWIPPRPPISFPKWIIRLILLILLIVLGLWAIPKLLSRWIWPPLAYGIPTFILCLSAYWLPSLYPNKRQEKLWVWLIFSAAFAVLLGWVMNGK